MDPASMISFLIEEGRLHAAREQDLDRWYATVRHSGRPPTWAELGRVVDMQRETLQHQATFCFAMISFIEQVHQDHQDRLEQLGEDASEVVRAHLRRRVREVLSPSRGVRRAASALRRLGDLLDGGAPSGEPQAP